MKIGEPLLLFRNKKHVPISLRERIFDSFVLYYFDSDGDFVMNQLLPEFVETRDFKLCIHSGNSTPGCDIKDNIEEAIEGSNWDVPGFVDSMWCKEEFTHCDIKNMKDAAFNLFIIMMQPADTLVSISLNMTTFFANKTYLQVNDPELFTNLATHLEIARKQDDDDDDDGNRYEICNNIYSEDEEIKEFKLIWNQDERIEINEITV